MPGGFTDMSSWKMALPGFIALTFSIISLKADIDFSVVAAIHLLLARIIACPGSNLGSILTIHSSGMKLGCTSYLWAAMTSCQHRSLTWLKPANFKFFYMAKSIDELLPSRETVTQSGSFPRCILALLCKCMVIFLLLYLVLRDQNFSRINETQSRNPQQSGTLTGFV
jgi:hypothetical protein